MFGNPQIWPTEDRQLLKFHLLLLHLLLWLCRRHGRESMAGESLAPLSPGPLKSMYLEGQWPKDWGFFVLILGYFGVEWPDISGYLGFPGQIQTCLITWTLKNVAS